MDLTTLSLICKQNGGFLRPELNDELFFQCKGFKEIRNLERYTEARCLWLEQNAIEEIKGLECLSQLSSLMLQNNVIRRISGLEALRNLRILNLSNNYITCIENIADFCPLETLQLAHNRIPSLEACLEVLRIPQLNCLDLSFNLIGEEHTNRAPYNTGAEIAEFFTPLKSLAVLYLYGNDLARQARQYRRGLVAGLPQLMFLDQLPVTADEREAVEAWVIGGDEAEHAARAAIGHRRQEDLTRSCGHKFLEEMEKSTREARAQFATKTVRSSFECNEARLIAQEEDNRMNIEMLENTDLTELIEAAADTRTELNKVEVELHSAQDTAAQAELNRLAGERAIEETFRRWERLEAECAQGASQAWLLNAEERERAGQCVGDNILKKVESELVDALESLDTDSSKAVVAVEQHRNVDPRTEKIWEKYDKWERRFPHLHEGCDI